MANDLIHKPSTLTVAKKTSQMDSQASVQAGDSLPLQPISKSSNLARVNFAEGGKNLKEIQDPIPEGGGNAKTISLEIETTNS
ncbi:polygalacturonase 1 beta-like protein 3 [Sesbania bispinosa]|nr:polygalacturonase 1 beta-like protein 3 [Sesbania bispinosa]